MYTVDCSHLQTDETACQYFVGCNLNVVFCKDITKQKIYINVISILENRLHVGFIKRRSTLLVVCTSESYSVSTSNNKTISLSIGSNIMLISFSFPSTIQK